jgi:hypothetical protein
LAEGVPGHGWLRIDPRTGATVGVMGSGYHQAKTERAIIIDGWESNTVIAKTRIMHPGYLGRGRAFWKQHPFEIAKKLGLDPSSIEEVGLIIDHQWNLLAAGLL